MRLESLYVVIEQKTRIRLRRRAEEDDKTYGDVIDQLLDETAVEVDLEKLVRDAVEQYEHVPQIAIEHTSVAEPSEFTVLVWGAPCIEEELEIIPREAMVSISRDDETMRLPVRVQGQGYLPPSRDTRHRTTVYLNSDEGSVDIEKGIEYFKEKFQDPEAWEEDYTGDASNPLQVQ